MFSITRECVLSLIAYSSYRVLKMDDLKAHKKTVILGFLIYSVLLTLDWSTIFLSPTHLDFAAYFYMTTIPIAFLNALIFQKIYKLSNVLFIPYILWMGFMGILHYHLYVNNHDGQWFANNENSTVGSLTTVSVLKFKSSDY